MKSGFNLHTGLIEAERVASQVIAGLRIGSGPRPPTNAIEFASSAFAPIVNGVPNAPEQLGVAVDFYRTGFPNVSSRQWQKTGRVDLAGVRDEHDPVAIAHAKSHPYGAAPDTGGILPLHSHL